MDNIAASRSIPQNRKLLFLKIPGFMEASGALSKKHTENRRKGTEGYGEAAYGNTAGMSASRKNGFKNASDRANLSKKRLSGGGRILHEQEYNTGHGIPAVPDEIGGEIWRQPCRPEVQQEPILYLFPAGPPEWERRISGLPVAASSQPSETEPKLIRDMRRRNPQPGLMELWHRLKQRGCTRRPGNLFRVMRKRDIFP